MFFFSEYLLGSSVVHPSLRNPLALPVLPGLSASFFLHPPSGWLWDSTWLLQLESRITPFPPISGDQPHWGAFVKSKATWGRMLRFLEEAFPVLFSVEASLDSLSKGCLWEGIALWNVWDQLGIYRNEDFFFQLKKGEEARRSWFLPEGKKNFLGLVINCINKIAIII